MKIPFITPEQDKKYLEINRVQGVKGPVNHVGNHEVRKCKHKKYLDRWVWDYFCWKCEQKMEEPNEFRETACHHCTCEFCPKE